MGVTAALTCIFSAIKSPQTVADTECMITSIGHRDYAVEIAFGVGVPRVYHAIHDVPIGVVQAAILAAENAPDLREDRVELAMVHMGNGKPDSQAVAQAMISTIIADSTR